MPSTPSFTQSLHVSIEDREKPVFSTAISALGKTCVVSAHDRVPSCLEW
uniref:Uncharacterized protein n=1 Tax=Pseudomonas fluorescens (strain SBW25) TaxID=216595 RepID=A0A0G4E5H3_PSEFS|nr:hypothetical protein PQBR57_0320 [Pseudomonas fluorescens SBW25]